MTTRGSFASALAMVCASLLLTAGALTAQQQRQQQREAFSPERFSALQQQGALILVEVFADWCPTCAMQQRVLTAFREQHPTMPLHTLTVNFDTQKEWVRHFGAPRQSTLIIFKGRERLWFSVAETRADVIGAQLTAAASSQ
jgi:thiol:disulfide interchange protein